MSLNQTPQTDRGGSRRFTEGPEADRFRDAIHSVCRKLLFSTKDESDRQFLYDVLRDRPQFRFVHRLAAISAKSTRPEHQGLLEEALSHFSSPTNPMSVPVAFDYELEAQNAADLAQREVERFPSAQTKATALDKITAHINALKQAARSVHAMVVR